MGVAYNPGIVTNGLVFALDGANYKSFKGEVTTNLIPSPTINAYPTTGNGWGTYNTNQYNGAQYFSIGSISSVSNNIITTSTNHPLRTYDTVTPQTTGGGVTAGTVYFVKKLSNTTFTLHEYNSSQDGSQGYISSSTGTHKVYDSIANDTRISVNASSFPTMWWGPPHLPNSGLVKELRYGEFNAIPNLPANDCIRLHYIRTDDVKDGMSYGVDCSVTAGSPVTISFYTRAANANAVGKVVQYYIYNYTGGSAQGYAWNFTIGQLGVWERQTFTYTPAYGTMISYWFPNSGGVYSWDWSCMQVEQKSYVTNFVAGTRGSTVATGGGWADLTGNGNHGTIENGVRENADNLGSLVFDGSNDFILPFSNATFGNNTTWEAWIYCTANVSTYNMFMGRYLPYFGFYGGNSLYFSNNIGGSQRTIQTATNLSYNTWYHATFTTSYDGVNTTMKIYTNGVETATGTWAGTQGNYSNPFMIGDGNNGSNGSWYPFQGRISNVKIYNGTLSTTEIQQNFNALRSRYSI